VRTCAPFLPYFLSPKETRKACEIVMMIVGMSVFSFQTSDKTGRFSRNWYENPPLEDTEPQLTLPTDCNDKMAYTRTFEVGVTLLTFNLWSRSSKNTQVLFGNSLLIIKYLRDALR
jgi:hypothetical protein